MFKAKPSFLDYCCFTVNFENKKCDSFNCAFSDLTRLLWFPWMPRKQSVQKGQFSFIMLHLLVDQPTGERSEDSGSQSRNIPFRTVMLWVKMFWEMHQLFPPHDNTEYMFHKLWLLQPHKNASLREATLYSFCHCLQLHHAAHT